MIFAGKIIYTTNRSALQDRTIPNEEKTDVHYGCLACYDTGRPGIRLEIVFHDPELNPCLHSTITFIFPFIIPEDGQYDIMVKLSAAVNSADFSGGSPVL